MKNTFIVMTLVLAFSLLSARAIRLSTVVPDGGATYFLVVSELPTQPDITSYVELGFATQIFVEGALYESLSESLDPIGEGMVFSGSAQKVKQIADKLGIAVKSRQYIAGYEIIYGYSKKLKASPVGDFNIQIAWKADRIVIGSPIIFGEI